MNPRATVLMPAYDAEATLAGSVASVLGQTMGDLELVVADDASTIPVAEVLADVRDPRLRIVRHARNGGIGKGRNTGLRLARAPAVCQLDADDLWEPTFLESMLPELDRPCIGLAYCNVTILDHPEGHEDYIGDPSIHPRDTFPELVRSNPIPCPTAVMRTDAVRAVGGYSSWFRGVEDWHLYIRLAATGWRFAYRHERLACYRWPSPERGMSYDTRRLERWAIAALMHVGVRHPGTEGARSAAVGRVRRYVSRSGCGS